MTTTPRLPRVLLVDDDASMRRLVELTLEDHPLSLRLCASVAEARVALAEAPVELLITDLMMPGESGFDLLDQLAALPALRGAARIVVFSAGLDAAASARLAPHDVWRQLAKPVSILALQACVTEALDTLPHGAGTGAGTAAAPPATEVPADAADPLRAAAIREHFGGDAALYDAYRASCLLQFGADLRTAEAAWAARDAVALRHLAHGLKSVLRMLGHRAAGDAAHAVERAAAAGDWGLAARDWPEVERLLRVLHAGPTP